MRQPASLIARDPTLVPGVYNYCDQWCSYCPLTRRCLAFRVHAEWEAERGRDGLGDLAQVVEFSREVARADGVAAEALDAVLSPGPVRPVKVPAADESIVRGSTSWAISAPYPSWAESTNDPKRRSRRSCLASKP